MQPTAEGLCVGFKKSCRGYFISTEMIEIAF